MANYYETGSAPDINNLLGKLRTALAANGWTVNYNDNEGSSGGQRVHVSKGGMAVNFRTGFNNEVPVANVAERNSRQGTWNWNWVWGNPQQTYRPNWLFFNVSTGLNMSRSWHNQPGGPGSSELKGLASGIVCTGSISRYWIFINENPDTVLLIAEVRPGKFEHIAFGRLILTQNIQAGGEWFSGSRIMNRSYTNPQEVANGRLTTSYVGDDTASMFRVVDTRWTAPDQMDGWNQNLMTPGVPNSWGQGNFWALLGVPVPDSSVQVPSVQGYYNVIDVAYLDDEGRSILHPIGCYKYMETSGLTLVGYLGHIARTSLKAYVAGDPIAGVGETYMAFPSHERLSPWNVTVFGSSPSDPSTQSYNFYGTGIAVRKSA